MNRRHSLAKLAAIPLVFLDPLEAKELPENHQDYANDFAEKYNAWITFRKVVQEGIVDVKEVRAWREACKAWDSLRKVTQY